jgi:hypothetical protein
VDPEYYTVTASFAGDYNYLPASATATIMIAYEARTLAATAAPPPARPHRAAVNLAPGRRGSSGRPQKNA